MALSPLQGFTVGITAARRGEDQAQHLTSRGAEVLHAPALSTRTADPEGELRRVTEELIRHPPALTVLTTGAGAAAWLSAADSFGAGTQLLDALRQGVIIPRGPKTVAACVQAGLDVPRHAGLERVHQVVEAASAGGLAGSRVAVQLDGADTSWLVDALRAQGAQVIPVRVYRWHRAPDDERLLKLINAVCRGKVQAVTFTSTPAVRNVFARAREAGLGAEFVEAFASGAAAAVSIGPVTTEALHREGVTNLVEPTRTRLGAMIAALIHHLEGRRQSLMLAGSEVLVQGAAVLVDGTPRTLSEQDRRLLAVLAQAGGRVVPKQALLHIGLGTGAVSEHAVEVAVARLRQRLGPAGPGVQTVFRRGYRLALDGAGTPASTTATSITSPVRRTS